MKLKFRMEACLFAKSLGKLKKKNHPKKKKKAQIKEKFNCKHKHRQIGTKYVKGKKV